MEPYERIASKLDIVDVLYSFFFIYGRFFNSDLGPFPVPILSMEDWMAEGPPACTVISVPIPAQRASKACYRFAKQLTAFGQQTNRIFSGYVKVESPTIIRACIITTNTQSTSDLNALWYFLKNMWPTINPHDITYENDNHGYLTYLGDPFLVIQLSREGGYIRRYHGQDDNYDYWVAGEDDPILNVPY